MLAVLRERERVSVISAWSIVYAPAKDKCKDMNFMKN